MYVEVNALHVCIHNQINYHLVVIVHKFTRVLLTHGITLFSFYDNYTHDLAFTLKYTYHKFRFDVSSFQSPE